MNTNRDIHLDCFRGVAIAGMILANLVGSRTECYGWLVHAQWNGLTLADLVFPFFLTAMGMSLAAINYQPGPEKIIKRTTVLFFLGLFLNSYPFIDFSIETMRIPGVLQRIALCYAMAAILISTLSLRQIGLLIVILLSSYLALLLVTQSSLSPSNNIAREIDVRIFGLSHMYTMNYSDYGGRIKFDPEGLLGTIPATCSTLIGYLAYKLHVQTKKNYYLIISGIALMTLGLLTGYSDPINKKLWSTSYTLVTSGIGLSLYWLISLTPPEKTSSTWLNRLGVNAISIYVLHALWGKSLYYLPSPSPDMSCYQWLYTTFFVPIAGSKGGSLLFALVNLILFIYIATVLYKRRWKLRV